MENMKKRVRLWGFLFIAVTILVGTTGFALLGVELHDLTSPNFSTVFSWFVRFLAFLSVGIAFWMVIEKEIGGKEDG